MIKLEIAVSAPVKNTYTYSAEPEGTDLSIDASYAGRRVLIPFGRRPATGYVLGEAKAEEGDFEIKPILKFVDDSPLFHSDQIAFFRWVAHYYHYPLGLVIKTALPGGVELITTTDYTSRFPESSGGSWRPSRQSRKEALAEENIS